jgi:type IV secretory pathway VirJ component
MAEESNQFAVQDQSSDEHLSLRDPGVSVPQSEPSYAQKVQLAADNLVAAKTKLNSDMKVICSEMDSMYKISSEFNKDTRRLQRGVDALPVLEDWVQEKVSAIEQLKSQIIFLHKIMDEE